MKPFTLTYSCRLPASIQQVCAFHTDTRNLPLITPPWIKVTIVKMDVPMVEKSSVVLNIRRFGISTLWEMSIDTLQCPHTIADVMLRGPFRYFRHQRVFTAINDTTTQMEESLSVALPLGWLGRFVFPLLKNDMDRMFAYRHEATRRYFLKNNH